MVFTFATHPRPGHSRSIVERPGATPPEDRAAAGRGGVRARAPVAPAGHRPAACALVLAAILALSGCDGSSSATPGPGPSSTGEPKPRPVHLVPAQESVTDRRVSATGTLAADEQVVLGTKVAGRVGELFVDLGTRVRRGQTVARLDPTDAQLRVDQAMAALQQARARLGLAPQGTDDRVEPEQTSLVRQARAVLDEARLTRHRMEGLWQEGMIARAQLDAAVAGLGVAEGRYQDALEEVRTRQAVLLQRRSELELARQQLADTVLTAPVDGAVSERRASVGEYLAAGAPVATMVKLHPLRLRLAVPEREGVLAEWRERRRQPRSGPSGGPAAPGMLE